MIGDHYGDKWRERWPQIPWGQPNTNPFPGAPNTNPFPAPSWPQTLPPPPISRAEFEDLKKEVADMKELLTRAKAYDAANGEPDCEIDSKMDLLRMVAKWVGVELDDVITRKAP